MMGWSELYIWEFLGCFGLAIICKANHDSRTLLLLKSGSSYSFDAMWNSSDATNDPYGNKSLLDVYHLLETDSTDFKANIDLTENITEVLQAEVYAQTSDMPLAFGYMSVGGPLEIIGLNALGDELCYALFDVIGINITLVDYWYKSDNLLDISLSNWDSKTLSTVARDRNKELLLKTNSNEAWFSILHLETVPGPNSRILLAVNSSAALTINNAVTDVTEEGCWANWELSLTLSFTDVSGLTVETCLLNCDSPYVALQLGENCYCADFLSQFSPVASMCTISCPGDGAYTCGGTNDGYYSVYSATYETSDLENITSEPESVLLLSFNHSSEYNYTINITSELLSRGWLDGYIYIDRISVNATNSTGHVMLYSFEYLDDIGIFREYSDNGIHYFVTDGTPVNLHVIVVTTIRILYEWDVIQSTIHLYGPTANSYVSVPFLAVVAYIGETISTTTSGTTTALEQTTTTSSEQTITTSSQVTSLSTAAMQVTSLPTTHTVTFIPSTVTSLPSTNAQISTTAIPVTSVYDVYPNMSVSVNGTLYCPCYNISWQKTTPNLTSIFEGSNKTFDELLADLTLDANTLSSNYRKYNSARDSRASATTIGTLGIIVIVSTVSLIVYLDSATLVKEATKIRKTYKILKKRISKRSLRVESINIEGVQDTPNTDLPDSLK